jgi:putative transposase
VSGANVHDVKLLDETLDGIIVKRPKQGGTSRQHLCADKGYAGEPAEKSIRRHKYIPHVRQRGEEIAAMKRTPNYHPRRWVVERTHSWLNRYRKLLVRYEKYEDNYEGLLELACALIAYRQTIVIYG